MDEVRNDQMVIIATRPVREIMNEPLDVTVPDWPTWLAVPDWWQDDGVDSPLFATWLRHEVYTVTTYQGHLAVSRVHREGNNHWNPNLIPEMYRNYELMDGDHTFGTQFGLTQQSEWSLQEHLFVDRSWYDNVKPWPIEQVRTRLPWLVEALDGLLLKWLDLDPRPGDVVEHRNPDRHNRVLAEDIERTPIWPSWAAEWQEVDGYAFVPTFRTVSEGHLCAVSSLTAKRWMGRYPSPGLPRVTVTVRGHECSGDVSPLGTYTSVSLRASRRGAFGPLDEEVASLRANLSAFVSGLRAIVDSLIAPHDASSQ